MLRKKIIHTLSTKLFYVYYDVGYVSYDVIRYNTLTQLINRFQTYSNESFAFNYGMGC